MGATASPDSTGAGAAPSSVSSLMVAGTSVAARGDGAASETVDEAGGTSTLLRVDRRCTSPSPRFSLCLTCLARLSLYCLIKESCASNLASRIDCWWADLLWWRR